MHDMNFFSDMSSEQKKVKGRLFSVIIVLLIVVGILAAAFIGMNIFFDQQDKDLQARRDKLTSPEVSEQLSELEKLQAEIAKMQSSAGALQELDRFLKINPNIDTAMLDALVDSMPADLIIDSLSANASQIAISGRALNERSPLVFSAALKENGYFDGVFLSVLARKAETETDPNQPTTEPVETQEPGETVQPAPTEPAVTNPATEAGTIYTFSLTCQIQAKSIEKAGENQ
jgi:Tfp pilus assembly protein PilN